MEEKNKMENTTQSVTQTVTPNVTQRVIPGVNQERDNSWLLKKQTIKKKISELGCQVGHDFFSRFNEFIESNIVKAVYRTKCNKRKTVRGMDI